MTGPEPGEQSAASSTPASPATSGTGASAVRSRPRLRTSPPPSYDDEWGPPQSVVAESTSPIANDPAGAAGTEATTDEAEVQSDEDGWAAARADDAAGATDDSLRTPVDAGRQASSRETSTRALEPSTEVVEAASSRERSRPTVDTAAPASDADEATPGANRRAFTHEPVDVGLPELVPIPPVPEPGLWPAMKYTVAVTRARWQRRSASKKMDQANVSDQSMLDETLGALGRQARVLGLDEPILAKENQALDRAEKRRADIEHQCDHISNQQAEEESAFADVEAAANLRASDLERQRDGLQREVDELEARRRGFKDRLDTVQRQQRGYRKAAEQRDEEAGRAAMGDTRSRLRVAAEELRRDAAALEADKTELERQLAALERPKSQTMARQEDLQAQLDLVRRELQDARDQHRHRMGELEAEQNRSSRELSQADAEISRHLTTLGTLVNLHRIEHPELASLYQRIDELRSAIGARSTEIDRLTADSEAYDRESYRRGTLLMGAGLLGFILFLLILKAIF